MTKQEWLKLPVIVRWWRIKTCTHPFHLSTEVGTVVDETKTNELISDKEIHENRYVEFRHHVRKCGHCNRYFLDSGIETNV